MGNMLNSQSFIEEWFKKMLEYFFDFDFLFKFAIIALITHNVS